MLSNGGEGDIKAIRILSCNLIQGFRDVDELTEGHIIFVTLYVNAGTWSLNVLKVGQVVIAITSTPVLT